MDRRQQLKNMFLNITKNIRLCPYLLQAQGDKHECNKPESCCNGADCEVYKIVVDEGAY
jgi:hypothetical protein